MLFSRAAQTAILAMTYLAAQEPGRLIAIREISEGADVPTPFLGKLISLLSRANLITARRGPNGGAMLNRRPSGVTVGDIVEAIDGPISSRRCILGLPECSDRHPCPLHKNWKKLELQLNEKLHELTLAELDRVRKRQNSPLKS
jgi:Rrf2 family protein